MKYASPELVQLLDFPGLFINHFGSIRKITFSAKFELPDTSKIFLQLTTVFSFELGVSSETYLTLVAASQRLKGSCFSALFFHCGRV